MLPIQRFPIPALLLSGLLLAGCVTTESNLRAFAQLRDTPDCCLALADIPIEQVASKETRFEIDANSPVFTFAQRKSYFRAFELPPEGSEYTLIVKTFPAYAPYAPRTPFFMPGLLFLNDKKEPTAYFGPDRARYVRETMFEGAGLATRVTVAKDDRPRYLVVFTPANSPEDGGGANYRTPATMTPVMIGGTMVPISSGGGQSSIEPMPTGSLKLTVEPKPAAQ